MNTKLAVLLGALGVALTISACSYSIASNYEPNTMTETHAESEISIAARHFYWDNEDTIDNDFRDITLVETTFGTTTLISPKIMVAIYDNEIDLRFSIQNLVQTSEDRYVINGIEQNFSFRYLDEENETQVSDTLEESITYDRISNYYELRNVHIDFYFYIENFNTETKDMTIDTGIIIEADFYNTRQVQEPIIKSLYKNQDLTINGNFYAGSADFFDGYNFVEKIRNRFDMYMYFSMIGAELQEQRIYNEGYDAGETAGQNNVISNPNEYNLYTGEQLAQVAENANTEIIDLPGVMLHVLSMPWTFISNAFDLTLWPGTPYQINFANIFKGLIAILALMFIIKMFTNGFNALGNVASSAEDRKNKKADTNLKNSQAKLNDAKTSKIESKS